MRPPSVPNQLTPVLWATVRGGDVILWVYYGSSVVCLALRLFVVLFGLSVECAACRRLNDSDADVLNAVGPDCDVGERA